MCPEKIHILNQNKKGGTQMTHYQVWHAIELFAKEHGFSVSGLARRSGLDPTSFNKSKRSSVYGQPHWPSMLSIAKILKATNSKPNDFFKFIETTPSDKK